MFFSWDWVTSNLNLDSNREVWLKVEVIADHVCGKSQHPSNRTEKDREVLLSVRPRSHDQLFLKNVLTLEQVTVPSTVLAALQSPHVQF